MIKRIVYNGNERTVNNGLIRIEFKDNRVIYSKTDKSWQEFKDWINRNFKYIDMYSTGILLVIEF